MRKELTKEEVTLRLEKFRRAMDQKNPDWETAVFVSKINQYYFTGTLQDGLLIIRRDGKMGYFVRRSYERARDESPFEAIYPMNSYRDAAGIIGADCGKTFIEKDIMTLSISERLSKYFNMAALKPLDQIILHVRAVKTPYELSCMEEAGRIHDTLMIDVVPTLVREGMSETDLCVALLGKMYEHEFHGTTRFQMFQTDLGLGQIGFGTSTLYPTYFDGPGGHVGLSAVAPMMGDRTRVLKRRDAIFIDIGFGIKGYNSDKSQAYIFGAQPSEETLRAHRRCMEIQHRIATLLVPGAVPADIYRTVMDELDEDFKENFMGYGKRQVKFLGHGIGLHVDEPPVIAEGFNDPIEENMVFAVEPKKGMPGVGLVGVEDTYVVTKNGARCLTGGARDIIVI